MRQEGNKLNEKTRAANYPMHPNYGKIIRYEEVAVTVPEQRQLRQPGLERSEERRVGKECRL